MAYEIRGLAIDLFNKHDMLAQSRRVALRKMVLTGDHADPGEVARFLAEAEVVAADPVPPSVAST